MKEYLKNKSLKKKTILFILIITVLCAVVSAFIVSQVVETQMTDKYEVDKEAAIEMLSHSLAPMLDLYDYKQVELVITSSLIYESIASVAVFDDRGTLIRSATKQNFPAEDLDVEKCNITSKAKVIGSVEIGFSKEYINEQIRTTTAALSFGLIGVFVLIGLLLYYFISRSVIEPLEAFTETVKGMNPENLSTRVKIHRKDELGMLAASFNRMAEDVEKSRRALQRAHDNLEEKVAERTEELAHANTRLKELDRLKSMFIASMSHELRTPLNSIIGFTGIILQGMAGEITGEQSKQLTLVKNSANHLLALINDIIDVSKIEAGKIELAIGEFDLSDLVQDVKDSFTVATDEKGLKMSLEIPERLLIESDARRVKQIIVNLVSNAVKFTEQGEIEIRAAKKDGAVELSVKDTGIGIRKEDIDRLFKAFSRIPTEGRLTEGTGLGLYLSQKIAYLLGGRISAESEFGRGSKFTFALPLKYQEAKA